MLFGLLGAAVAAIAYGAATIWEAIGVRNMAALPPGSSLIQRGRAGALFAAGMGLDALGFFASAAALRTLPLFLVESVVAAAVAVTAILAVLVLGARLARIEVIALLVVAAGLVLLATAAQEGPARRTGGLAGWLVLAAVIPLALMMWAELKDPRPGRSSALLAAVSGAGFGLVGVAARMLQIADPWWHTVASPLLWAMVGFGIVSIVTYGFALDRGRTTTVAAITFGVETVLPAIIGLAFLGDAVRPGLTFVAVLGFAATLAGCITLAGRSEPDLSSATVTRS